MPQKNNGSQLGLIIAEINAGIPFERIVLGYVGECCWKKSLLLAR
jgi:hypothetical protein